MIRDWLHRNEIEAFAVQLAGELRQRCPPEGGKRKDADRRLVSVSNRLFQRAAEFSRAKRLGVYGRAKLGNAFKWKLTDLGYTQAFADTATHELILSLSRSRPG
jgi:hypothetical protein